MEKEVISETADQVRLGLANDVVKRYMWWTMGAGLIPVPFVDMLAVSGVQLKMLKDIGDVYEVKFSENKGKSIVAALLGSIVPNALVSGGVGHLFKVIPVVGPLMKGLSMSLFSGAATYAIGKVFIQHFESGGTFLDFNPTTVKDYFQSKFEEGKDMAKDMSGTKSKKEG